MKKLIVLPLISILLILASCVSNSSSTPTTTRTPPSTEPAATRTEKPVTLRLELTGEPWSDKFMTGLSGRESLEGGMLFDFEDTVSYGFQMRETLIPLSIGFISEEFRLVEILDMEPLAQEPYNPSKSYRYAIEVNQGFFTENRISIGDRVEFVPSPVEGYVDIIFMRD